MTKQRTPLPGQRELPFDRARPATRKTKPAHTKYDPLLEKPIATSPLTAFSIITSKERYIQLWSYGATITDAREHFLRVHPECPVFTIGMLGVGEFLVDAVEHAWIPDSRCLDQDGYLTARDPHEKAP